MATRTKRIQVVLSEDEFEKFKQYAKSKGLAMSEILRDYVKSR
jgi:predicted DNA binding CopG/RHH family protein